MRKVFPGVLLAALAVSASSVAVSAPKKSKPAVAEASEPAPPPPVAAKPAFVIDPRWGVLGEVAERDFTTRNLFTLGTEVPIAFRWVVPNQEMLLTYLGPPKGEHRLKLDPATGEIERSWKNLFGTTKEALQVDASGNVIIAGTTDMMFLRKNDDGTYWLRWSVDNKQTLTPLTNRTPKIEQLFAESGVKPGRTGLSRAVDATALAALSGGSALAGKPGPALASSLAAPAFDYADIGVDMRGAISAPGKADCYYIETTPGQKLMVRVNGGTGFDPLLIIGAGATCDKLRQYGYNDDYPNSGWSSQIDFVAGGGTYVARVSGMRKTTGDYALGVNEMPNATRKYGPGLPIARVVQPQFADGISASTAPLSGTPAPAPGTVIKDCAECPELVVVKAGSFFMGSSAEEEGRAADEGPRHRVTIGNPFAIGKYEVTFDEFDACVKDKGCARAPADNGWGRGRRPAFDVSWNEAMQYVRWLRRKTGQNYYLPSEAEWEYAARAGTTTPWNTGSAIITDDANILNALGRTVPVGGYPANAFGLHDTHGNTTEWTADCSEVGYFGVPTNGAAMATKGCRSRVARGGSFHEDPFTDRVANRRLAPVSPETIAGFRVARSL